MSTDDMIDLLNQEGTETEVCTCQLTLDLSYATIPSERRWRKMADGWKPALFGRPVVSDRNEYETQADCGPTAYLIDGAHRIFALRARKGAHTKIKVLMVHGLDRETEAWLFRHLNTDHANKTLAVILNADITAGDPEATDIHEVCATEGVAIYGVDRQPPHGQRVPTARVGATLAIAALRKIYRDGGKLHLRKTVEVLRLAWGDQHGAFDRLHLLAVSDFLRRFKQAKPDRLVRTMERAPHGPGQYLREVASLREHMPGGRPVAVYGSRVLALWYDSGLRQGRLLQDDLPV